VQLQFQDRVGQILSQVVASMNDLSTQTAQSTCAAERATRHRACRADDEYYTTDEQRLNHQGIETTSVEQSAVTFF